MSLGTATADLVGIAPYVLCGKSFEVIGFQEVVEVRLSISKIMQVGL